MQGISNGFAYITMIYDGQRHFLEDLNTKLRTWLLQNAYYLNLNGMVVGHYFLKFSRQPSKK